MQAPTSYAGPRRNEGAKRTYSQTVNTNVAKDNSYVRDLIARKGNAVVSVSRNDEILHVIEVLKENGIGAVLVMSESGVLEGILSERDIVRKMIDLPGRVRMQKVETLMTENVQTCSPEETLTSVLKRMTEGRFRHMPVVEAGKLAGILSIGDVVHYRLNELEHEAVQLKQIIVG